jgi:hypothetical protein
MARPTPIALSALLLTLALASPLWARPGRVAMKDGKVWEGDVVERKKDNQIDIVIEGKKYTFSMDNMARAVEYDDSIAVTPAPAPGQPQPGQPGQPRVGQPQPGQPARGGPVTPEEFERRRSRVANNDVNGLLALSRWAFEGGMYDQAYDAARDARDADPRNQDAQTLLRNIDAQRKLNRKTGAQGPVGRPGAAPAVAPGVAPGTADAQGGPNPDTQHGTPQRGGPAKGSGDNGLVRPLAPDEVNRVRLMEWRGDKGVKVRLTNDVKRRYLARSTMAPAEFNRLDGIDQALEIKKRGSPELLNDVRITSDPPPLAEYRTHVQRAVLASCATAACHGGGAGSDRFALHPRADHEGEAYANFITLNKYQYKPEKGRAASMIDRNRPEDSLLIQFGLPPAVSNMPHPQVDGYRPTFKGVNDPKYRQFVKWIADSLSPLIEDYGVPFDDADQGTAQPAGNAEPPAEDSAPENRRAPAGQQLPPARGLETAPPPRGAAPAPRTGTAR